MLLVPLSLWVLVAVPAYNEGLVYCATGMPSYRFVEHGWPLVHMDRIDLDSLTADEVASAEEELRLESSFRWAKNTGTGGNWVLPGWGWWGWNEAANWKQTGAVAVIHKVALAINLLVAVAICAAVAGPYEWWRKRRFRYSLRSLLVLFVVVAAVFGWGRWRANQRSREAAAIEQLEKLGYAVDCRYWGPIWLARLVGEHHLSIFICAHQLQFVLDPFGVRGPESMDRRKVLDLVTELRTFTEVNLSGDLHDLHIEDAQWAKLAEMKDLEDLVLDETRISDFGIACLAKLPKLRLLVVTKLDDASVAKLRRALPKCEITGPADAATKPGLGFF